MEFVVNSSVEITSLGAYNPGSAGTITVAIYNVGSQTIVTNTLGSQLMATIPAGTTLTSGTYDAFVPLGSSYTLGAGTYMVVAWGYNQVAEGNLADYNSMDTAPVSTESTGSGLISFVAPGSYYGATPTASISFPTIGDGSLSNRYGAGTFQFIATPSSVCTVGGGLPPCAGGSACTSNSGCTSTICENSVCIGTTKTYEAYADGLQVGNQTNFTGSLGMDFTVVNPITVTQLGAFDSGGDGFTEVDGCTVSILQGHHLRRVFERRCDSRLGGDGHAQRDEPTALGRRSLRYAQ